MSNFCLQRYRNTTQGFTLVELLVSITIITIVSAVVIARNNAFEGAVLLRNQAYEVAFAIRQAQLLAVSGTESTANVRPVGVFISTANAQNQQIILFRDTHPVNNPNRTYNFNQDESLNTINIDRRFSIGSINGNSSNANISITFQRPNYDATFRGTVTTGPVSITIRNNRNHNQTRTVQVSATGQVTVLSQ